MSLDLGATWQQVVGTLAQMTTGDVNGDGVDDIIGVSSIGKIWYTTQPPWTWSNPAGTLAKIGAGPFQATVIGSDQIGGLSAARKIWVLVDPNPAAPVWVNPPGTADQVVPLKPGPGMAALNSQTGKSFTTPNLTTWTLRNRTSGAVRTR
ncbi:MAG: hypothetical protein MZV65_00285 [Chromatiales bacterium]|nr:hypothetical protein [Chromatiales bacterium]